MPTQGRLAQDVDYFARAPRLDMVFGVVKDDPEVPDLLPMTDIEEVGCGEGRRISEKGIPPAASTRRILDLQSVALVLPDHACRVFAAELGSSVISNCLRMGEQISGGSGLRLGRHSPRS